jgi:uncharacterized protein (TIRG00374 family)
MGRDPRTAATPTLDTTAALRLVLPALVGAVATWVLWRFATNATALPQVVLAAVPVYLGLWAATVVVHAWRWRLILRQLGADLPLSHLARLWLAARAVGSLIPSGTLGGEPVRIQLLTAQGVPVARATGAVALDRTLELAGNMIVGPLCVAAALALGAGSDTGAIGVAGGALTGLVLLVGIYFRARGGRPALLPLVEPPARILPRRWGERARQEATRADAALQRVLGEHPRLVPIGVAMSLLNEGLHFLELAALFAVFAISVPFPMLLLSGLGIGVAHAVPVTAALGTLEAAQVGLFTIGGEPLATGLAVAMAVRFAETLAILAGLACLATAWRGRRAVDPAPEAP